MKNCTLIIMAAGLGSRYGGGIKQLEPVGPDGEIIMDYSVYDAKAAGFDKIVFIIRKDIEQEFRERIGDRIAKHVNVEYVFQETSDIPEAHKKIERKKPWGTCHAVLCAKDAVKEPFAVINADDYYGRQAFVELFNFLTSERPASDRLDLCMAGFILKNTLSDNGAVTRGICQVDREGKLVGITETYNIRREGDKVLSGKTETKEVDENSHVSMNMWGCPPEFMDTLAVKFEEFLCENDESESAESLLPIMIDGLLKNGEAQCTLLESRDRWFGVTYKEDKQAVADSIAELIREGVYPEKLWELG
ncbi:Nucleotidyl transferase [Ruminococcaceae bacterium FB2012]|nr:Nucleotidyl transferase [Ruminococcaceae bacterium FB2012]